MIGQTNINTRRLSEVRTEKKYFQEVKISMFKMDVLTFTLKMDVLFMVATLYLTVIWIIMQSLKSIGQL